MRPLHSFLSLLGAGAVGGALCLGPSSALADKSPRQQAKEHTEQGSKFQKLGDYEKAIAEYQAAYDLIPHPQLLYNLAQAYRLNGDKEKALQTYQTFVSIESEGAAANKAKGFIVLLKEAIAEQANNAPSPGPAIAQPIASEPVPAEPIRPPPDTSATNPQPGQLQPVPGGPSALSHSSELSPSKPSFMDTPGLRLGAAFSFMQHDYGDGVGPSVQAGYAFQVGRIGLRPGARLDYFSLDDEDGDNELLHAGADLRVSRSMLGRIMPFASVGLGLSHFTHASDMGDEEDYDKYEVGFHVDAGVEFLVYDRYAFGAMFIANLSVEVENTVAGGGFTLTRY